MKSWLVGIAGVIAAVAVVASNLDKILSTGATWLGPYIIPYVSPHAVISVALDADLATAVDVFVADPSNETRVIALGQTHRDQKAVLNIPANTRYTIGWQGAGLEAGAAQHILAVKGESLFRLIRMGVADGQIRVSLRQSDPNQPELPTTEPSAKLLISARASQAATNPSIPISTGALPELDRATTIVGLFETGTTDCARRLYFIGRVPAVGCVGASIPGWLGEVITSLDAGDARRLDALLGENAASIRNYAQDRYAIPQETQLRQAMERLIAAPEFGSNIRPAYLQPMPRQPMRRTKLDSLVNAEDCLSSTNWFSEVLAWLRAGRAAMPSDTPKVRLADQTASRLAFAHWATFSSLSCLGGSAAQSDDVSTRSSAVRARFAASPLTSTSWVCQMGGRIPAVELVHREEEPEPDCGDIDFSPGTRNKVPALSMSASRIGKFVALAGRVAGRWRFPGSHGARLDVGEMRGVMSKTAGSPELPSPMQSILASTCFRTVSAIAGVTCVAMEAGSVTSALASRAGMYCHPLGGGSRPTCDVLMRVRLFFILPSSLYVVQCTLARRAARPNRRRLARACPAR
jgi:hypothetical protein